MKSAALIRQSAAFFDLHPELTNATASFAGFQSGAEWMSEQMRRLRGGRDPAFDDRINYTFYGVLKYTISLAGSIAALILSYRHCLWFLPTAVLVFYFFEIHFLFLFPILIDRAKRPIFTGFRLIYKIGVLKALFTVIPIAGFMLFGLTNRKNPFKNWYMGCLAVVFWYEQERKIYEFS
jgi:hypothetical protein